MNNAVSRCELQLYESMVYYVMPHVVFVSRVAFWFASCRAIAMIAMKYDPHPN